MAHKNKLPERYPNIIAMYAKGRANSLEILKTDFGHWPPNGLDIVNAPDINIEFKSVFSTKYGLKRLKPGWINLLMGLNLLKSYPISAVAFMAVTAFLRGIELGGFVDIHKTPERIHVNDLYRLFGFFQGGRRFLSHIISHEFKHVVQARDDAESLSSSLEDRLNIRNMRKADAGKMQKYLTSECEIQARLHTVIVGIYHQHEAMPLTKADLLAALASQGLKIPDEIIGRYVNQIISERWMQDEELFHRYADRSAIKQLNTAISSINTEKLYEFFSSTLPFIYGDLLELYGDQQGHKRMGHSHNIQLREMFYRSARECRDNMRGLPTQSKQAKAKYYANKAIKAIDNMDVEDAVDLACNIAKGELYHEYGDAELVCMNESTLGKAYVSSVYHRGDLRLYHKREIENAILGASHTSRSRSLISRRRGHNEPTRRKEIKPYIAA